MSFKPMRDVLRGIYFGLYLSLQIKFGRGVGHQCRQLRRMGVKADSDDARTSRRRRGQLGEKGVGNLRFGWRALAVRLLDRLTQVRQELDAVQRPQKRDPNPLGDG